MSAYPNSWSGVRQFYRGVARRLPTAKTDKDYLEYCAKKHNKDKILSYSAWVKLERRKY
jgi:hypothetical protein